MPDDKDKLGRDAFNGNEHADRADQSLGDGQAMNGDTDGNSLSDQSTFAEAHVVDALFDDGMKLQDLSERYTKEGVLGRGGMGEVILATDTRLGRKVAIKRILGEAARSTSAVARFLTEAKSMAELNHPNIVQIYDYGRATDGPFLIMEYAQNGSLLDKCKQGPIELEEAIDIFDQLCDGLAQAHVADIIHRDIKPANVLMADDGVPKLTDFGLAKDGAADTGMTMEGAVIGTLDFMPPEQLQAAEHTDHRSDLWSLAATFYQMVTGKSPQVINITLLPINLQSVLARALEESKEDRFQSALEMKQALRQVSDVGLNASRYLGEGECSGCGTTNPPDRKFCRNADCAASLTVECLNCKAGMPAWEVVCGSCGNKQGPLIEEAKGALQAKRDEAEVFLNELKFDDALKVASVIGEQDDLRLQQFASWHKEFSVRLESLHTLTQTRLEELIGEATTHEQAYDYEAGLQTLDQIDPTLIQIIVNGSKDTAENIKERLTTKQSRLKQLESLVRERVTQRNLSGLLRMVNELLKLKPNRPQVRKLRTQLEERDAGLLEIRANAYIKATKELDGQQYADAVATLNTVSEEVYDAQLLRLKSKAIAAFNHLNNLRDRITAAVNNDELGGLLPTVEECLTLKADQDDFVKLKVQLEKRDADLLVTRDSVYKKAAQQLVEQQYAEVIVTLNTVTSELWTEQFKKLETKAIDLLARLNNLRDRITWAVNDNQHDNLVPILDQCLTLKADQDDLVKLKEQIINREARMNTCNQQNISHAQTLMQKLQFDEAVQFLDTITPVYQSFTTTGLSQQARQLSAFRRDVLKSVPAALSNNNYPVAIKSISHYLREISRADVQDPQLQKMLDKIKHKSKVSIRSRKLVKLLVIMLITSVFIKFVLDSNGIKIAMAIETAITSFNQESTIELETNKKAEDSEAEDSEAEDSEAEDSEAALKDTEVNAKLFYV